MKRAFVATLFLSLFTCGFAQVAPNPIDKKATKEALQLYDYLRKDVWGKKVISGCQARWDYNTTDAQEIYNTAGKYPALNIFDFQHFRMDHIDYMADTALQWHKSGGQDHKRKALLSHPKRHYRKALPRISRYTVT